MKRELFSNSFSLLFMPTHLTKGESSKTVPDDLKEEHYTMGDAVQEWKLKTTQSTTQSELAIQQKRKNVSVRTLTPAHKEELAYIWDIQAKLVGSGTLYFLLMMEYYLLLEKLSKKPFRMHKS